MFTDFPHPIYLRDIVRDTRIFFYFPAPYVIRRNDTDTLGNDSWTVLGWGEGLLLVTRSLALCQPEESKGT